MGWDGRRASVPTRTTPGGPVLTRTGPSSGSKWRFLGMRKSLYSETPGTPQTSKPVDMQSMCAPLFGPGPGECSGTPVRCPGGPEIGPRSEPERFLPAFDDTLRNFEGPPTVQVCTLTSPLTGGHRSDSPDTRPGPPGAVRGGTVFIQF